MKAKRVYYGFLIGNLGKLAIHYRQFADAVKEGLEVQFPAAEIEIAYEKGSGTVPIHLQPRVDYETDELDAEQEEKDLDALEHIIRVVWDLLGGTIKPAEAQQAPSKKIEGAPVVPRRLINQSIPSDQIETTQQGLPEGWTRATFIVREDSLEQLKALAFFQRRLLKEIVEEALSLPRFASSRKLHVCPHFLILIPVRLRFCRCYWVSTAQLS